MNIISNDKLIKRNSRIAQITGLVGMGVLVVSMVLLFKYNQNPTFLNISWGLILAGFILSQVGIYFTNRWGRHPRPDEHLNMALKGLGSDYNLYHYKTPTPHLLVGPAGIWVLLPRHQRGTIVYEKGRLKQRNLGFIQGYLKIFGQEGIGRPDLEAVMEVDAVKKFLKKKLGDAEIPPIQVALIFTDERAFLETEESPIPVMPPKKLKEFIRRAAKQKPITTLKLSEIQAVFDEGKSVKRLISEEEVSEE